MKATFKIISLKRYKNVGNAQQIDIEKYLSLKNKAEQAIYGTTGGTYFLPTFEVTFENGISGIYENHYDGEIIEEISPEGLNLKVADKDTLGYFGRDAQLMDFQNLSITLELDSKYLNSDFEKNMYNIQNRIEEQYQEYQRKNIASQSVYAAGLRDCEVYVIGGIYDR